MHVRLARLRLRNAKQTTSDAHAKNDIIHASFILTKVNNVLQKISFRTCISTVQNLIQNKITFKGVMPENICKWRAVFEGATNCPKPLVFSVIVLTSALCRPGTMVSLNGDIYASPLNEYIFSVCDPGGGKSNTYDRVIEPAIKVVQEQTGLQISLIFSQFVIRKAEKITRTIES